MSIVKIKINTLSPKLFLALYTSVGFEISCETEQGYIMIHRLGNENDKQRNTGNRITAVGI